VSLKAHQIPPDIHPINNV